MPTPPHRTEASPRQPLRSAPALTAGLALLLMAALAFFAEFFVRARLIDPQDLPATLDHLRASGPLYRAGTAANLIVALLDVLVAVALYEVFRHAGQGRALFAATNRVVYAAVFATATLGQVLALRLAADPSASSGNQQAQLAAAFLDLHAFGWQVALIFFAVHLAALGGLIVRSGAAPRWIGALLLLAGAAYLTDALANVLLPNYAAYAAVLKTFVAIPALASELSLCAWLLTAHRRAAPAPRPAT
ncbi:DUF4386 domain-containing protein (plasmid) [Deinococcus taeanensis]|uniref:DUF4386 domain-containing protein n=1 Tax=Deinococcus taeanensis TaxID=2737050 RepID=UPI001CDD417C|nr:DUF4386 domain-containing protein [Deinococcus taeanensis]UBV44379.1 DUF4386 domain-containing protein [Deinococcus taeanensis]